MAMSKSTFALTAEHWGKRIDVVLAMFTQLSRNQVRKLIAERAVSCDEKIITKPGTLVKTTNTTMVVDDVPAANKKIIAEDIILDVLYEDEHIIAINKKPGMVVHPGVGHSDGTLVHALASYQQKHNTQELRLLHRLDKDTSGLILVSKNEKTYHLFLAMFEERTLEKIYLAILAGTPKDQRGYVDAPIDRALHDRQKFAVSSSHASRQALTAYQIIDFFTATSLVAVRIHTGRTHQIRVHMQSIGHPIIGDLTYYTNASYELGAEVQAKRQMLHAYRVTFIHPVTTKPITIVAPPPFDFRQVLGALSGKKYKIPAFSFEDYDYHHQW
jgi:23S rRNA pseudouridine1911/1915/1917 synthase